MLVVSSGAIALGRTVLGLGKRVLKLEESQAAAAVGQIALAGAWSEELGRNGLNSGQILLTLGDTEERRRYLNARATISTLLKMKAVPVINENDTVATSEIRYGDNDRLAARVATMMGADLLVLLSDIDGLYTAPPALDPNARFIAVVDRITPEIEAMAGAAASRAVARRHAHQARRRQDRHCGRHGDDHRRRQPHQSAGRDRPRRALDLLPPEPQPGARLQDAGSPGSSSRRAGCSSTPARSARCCPASRCLPPASGASAAVSRAATRSRSSIRTAARSRAGWLPMMPPMP